MSTPVYFAKIKDSKRSRRATSLKDIRADLHAKLWIVMTIKPRDWFLRPNVLIAIAFALMLLICAVFLYFEGGD